MQALLDIKNLSKDFYLHEADRTICGCHNISITVSNGEFVGITGKSGSGKTTILRSVYRTNLPQDGQIWYNSACFGPIDIMRASEQDIIYIRNYEIGYVSQFLNILPRKTAYNIVLQNALVAVDDEQSAHNETKQLLRHFDLPENLWGLYPQTFSGGEKLRLNIAAAMIKKPRLLLLDEPTASLDNGSKLKVRELLHQLKQSKTTMLGIFHDLEFMDGICDKEYNMEKGGFLCVP